jgi:hypothetical protein
VTYFTVLINTQYKDTCK